MSRPPGEKGPPSCASYSPPFDFSSLRAAGLTPRECEVLAWVDQGKRGAEIAGILGIARKTLGKHVEHLLAKRPVAAHGLLRP
jgi:DNA-binding HTH domain-containing proteins